MIVGSLEKVRAIGYGAVQASGEGPIGEPEFVKTLDAAGLALCAMHEPGNTILNIPELVIKRPKNYAAFPPLIPTHRTSI